MVTVMLNPRTASEMQTRDALRVRPTHTVTVGTYPFPAMPADEFQERDVIVVADPGPRFGQRAVLVTVHQRSPSVVAWTLQFADGEQVRGAVSAAKLVPYSRPLPEDTPGPDVVGILADALPGPDGRFGHSRSAPVEADMVDVDDPADGQRVGRLAPRPAPRMPGPRYPVHDEDTADALEASIVHNEDTGEWMVRVWPVTDAKAPALAGFAVGPGAVSLRDVVSELISHGFAPAVPASVEPAQAWSLQSTGTLSMPVQRTPF